MTRVVTAMLVLATLVVASWAIYDDGLKSGRAEVQAQWDAQRIADAAAVMHANLQARKREQALQSTADKIRQEKTREIRHLSAARDAALRELRNRTERRTAGDDDGQATNPRSAASCTGAELARQDAEFLVGEATRADKLKALLLECRAAYTAAQTSSE